MFLTSHHNRLYSTTTHAWTQTSISISISISISTHHATTDPFADADFGSPASSATAGAKANASRTSTPKIDDDLGGVAGGKIHIRESELLRLTIRMLGFVISNLSVVVIVIDGLAGIERRYPAEEREEDVDHRPGVGQGL
jgi:hypothetical protein